MKRSTLTRGLLPAAVVMSLALAACGGGDGGSDDEATTGAGGAEDTAAPADGATDEPAGEDTAAAGGGEEAELSGQIAGSGSSAQQAAQQAWVAGYNAIQPGVQVSYDPIGSGGGREAFLGGATQFAGSDAPLDDEELAASEEVCGEGSAINLPLYISPIAVIFNLEGVDSINMTPATIAGIFAEEITTWNDEAIAADNPDLELPDLPITPVHRADDSGTTDNFTEFLAETAPDVWTYEPDGEWPSELGGEAAPQTAGVVSAVQSANGYIGYADASQAGELGTVAVGADGEFTPFSPEAAAAVVDNSELVEGRPEGDLTFELNREAPGSYPIVLVAYTIICQDYEDDSTAELVKSYVGYMASAEGQQQAADNAGSAPISDDLRAQVEESLAAVQ